MLLNVHTSRGLGRPKSVFSVALVIILMYYLLLKAQESRIARLPHVNQAAEAKYGGLNKIQPQTTPNDENSSKNKPASNPAPVPVPPPVSSSETPKSTLIQPTQKVPPKQDDRAQQAKLLQNQYETEYKTLGDAPGAGSIYGKTLAHLEAKDKRSREQEGNLSPVENGQSFGNEKPYTFNPYPKYNSKEWKASHAEHVACSGPNGAAAEYIRVYKGSPHGFPDPGFGSYDILGIDKNICFEREGRLGQYGLGSELDGGKESVDWATVDWGQLQNQCAEKNKQRFDRQHPPNEFVVSGIEVQSSKKTGEDEKASQELPKLQRSVSDDHAPDNQPRSDKSPEEAGKVTGPLKEPRTAVLLRSYTGKQYTDNDKQVIRSLVTELSLRTGGEYQVFLLVHVKQPHNIWEDSGTYQFVVQNEVPREFWGMTVLWNDDSVRRMYPRLDEKQSKVHNAQYLSVQKFMQEHREFDFAWNWEMDSRAVGHHYDFVAKLAEFAKRQPRRGLWERSERFYIRDVHGEYDTEFRKAIELVYGNANDTVWGPPSVPGVKPLGPRPPVQSPQEDDYEWGVGEDADLITLSPIFNPLNSGWILRNQAWGYQADQELPRRATIITQSRLSRRLVDLMHAENLQGRHVGSEMMPQTVSLLHGLKAVYAPMPVFFDRPWTGAQLAKWFNPGPRGESGGFGSAMGWGREGRFQGATWYFRADPPQRMYNNWMGYEDTGVGGAEWEGVNGRPCLPAVMLHPVKDVRPTEKGSSSKSDLPYR